MDLSIIITHFNPGNHPNCLESFHKTLSSINKSNYSIEIIIADDGSTTNKKTEFQSSIIGYLDDTLSLYIRNTDSCFNDHFSILTTRPYLETRQRSH